MATSIKTPLDVEIIKSIRPQKLFHPSTSSSTIPLTSITHTYSGSHFITTSPSGTLLLYDSLRPKLSKTIYSKKYGCTAATFTARGCEGSTPQSCIVASTIPTTGDLKNDNAIRLLDLSTNAFSKYFIGHEGQVISLWGAPWTSEGFCSSSIDGCIKIWDTRTNSEISSVTLQNRGTPLVIGCDLSCQVMAIWEPEFFNSNNLNSNNKIGTLKFVPINGFPEGIIGQMDINKSDLNTHHQGSNDYRVESLKFTSNGLLIMGFVNQDLLVVDSLSLKIKGKLIGKRKFVDESNDVWRSTGCFDISWDSNWCFGGSGSDELLIWDLKSLTNTNLNPTPLTPFRRISSGIDNSTRMVNINPKFGTLVTGDNELVLHSIY